MLDPKLFFKSIICKNIPWFVGVQFVIDKNMKDKTGM